MHFLAKIGCLLLLVLTTSAYPHIAIAQADGSPTQSPRDSQGQHRSDAASQEQGWGRFHLGMKSGLSLTQFIGQDSASELPENTHKPDITLGAFGVIGLHKWASLQPEILFISKGRQVKSGGVLSNTLDANYIEIPLLARITIPAGERISPYLLAGPALGVLLKFQVERESDGSITDRTDQAKRLDLSGVAGAGIKVALTRRHELMIEGRYDRSFTRFLKDEDQDIKNHAFAFMLGYQYSLSSASSSPAHSPVSSSKPDAPGPRDSDGDGILDQYDQCPHEAEDMDGFQDEDGCPDPDNDGDGILDARDECPNQAGPLELRGCPDSDDDGVADHVDHCPNTPGTPALQGCNLVKLSQGKLELLAPVRFRPNGTSIEPDSHALLDEVADLIRARPELGQLRITVSQLTRRRNASNDPAQAQADQVKSYLVDKGVASERLDAVGEVERKDRGADELRVAFTIGSEGAEQDR